MLLFSENGSSLLTLVPVHRRQQWLYLQVSTLQKIDVEVGLARAR